MLLQLVAATFLFSPRFFDVAADAAAYVASLHMLRFAAYCFERHAADAAAAARYTIDDVIFFTAIIFALRLLHMIRALRAMLLLPLCFHAYAARRCRHQQVSPFIFATAPRIP